MDDQHWMRRCFSLARRGVGHVSPNPLVGAVLVHDNRIIGEGYHAGYGQPHAEVMAFDQVEPADRHLVPKSTLYVNLEPCHHYGKTPPCTLRIESEGIKQLVIGCMDTNPLVGGKGISHLRSVGVSVRTGVLEEEARWLNRSFFHFHEKNRPFVILKWAQTKDGFIGRIGERTTISGPLAQIVNHGWRREVDAILIGARTADVDDPALTDRWNGGPDPVRIVLLPGGRIDPAVRLWSDAGKTWVFSEKDAPGNLPENKRWYTLRKGASFTEAVLKTLYESMMNTLLIEGGRETINRWMKEAPWDEARCIQAPGEFGSGIAAPVIKGKLREEFMAGPDRIQIISRA